MPVFIEESFQKRLKKGAPSSVPIDAWRVHILHFPNKCEEFRFTNPPANYYYSLGYRKRYDKGFVKTSKERAFIFLLSK